MRLQFADRGGSAACSISGAGAEIPGDADVSQRICACAMMCIQRACSHACSACFPGTGHLPKLQHAVILALSVRLLVASPLLPMQCTWMLLDEWGQLLDCPCASQAVNCVDPSMRNFRVTHPEAHANASQIAMQPMSQMFVITHAGNS